jgi:hypothetical protein
MVISEFLCRADRGTLGLSEESGLRLAAVRGDPLLVSQVRSSLPVLAEQGPSESIGRKQITRPRP